jgi:predicted transcriptional regulator
MRQMITRLDDDLHEALKRKAKAEGKSLKTLVVDALEGTVEREISGEEELAWLRFRARVVSGRSTWRSD